MEALPHLELIFNKLRRGYHFTPEDGEVYRTLWDRFEEYQRLFDSLGLDLKKHPKNVVYLVANDNVQPGKQARRMGLFMLVLVEHFGETHSSIVSSLFDTRFRLENLPHLKAARYEEYMNAIDVHDAGDLEGIVRSLVRFGFAKRVENGFMLRKAAYRFLDLCLEASDLAKEESESEQDPTPPDPPNASPDSDGSPSIE
jgi:hypothetical protein